MGRWILYRWYLLGLALGWAAVATSWAWPAVAVPLALAAAVCFSFAPEKA